MVCTHGTLVQKKVCPEILCSVSYGEGRTKDFALFCIISNQFSREQIKKNNNSTSSQFPISETQDDNIAFVPHTERTFLKSKLGHQPFFSKLHPQGEAQTPAEDAKPTSPLEPCCKLRVVSGAPLGIIFLLFLAGDRACEMAALIGCKYIESNMLHFDAYRCI